MWARISRSPSSMIPAHDMFCQLGHISLALVASRVKEQESSP